MSTKSELAAGWTWAKFRDVASIDSNLVNPAEFPQFPHVAPDNVEKGTGRLLSCRTISEDGVTSSKNHFFPGQIVYSKIRPYLSKLIIADFEGLCSADMYPLTAHLDTQYLFRFMLSESFLDAIQVLSGNRVVLPKANQKQLNEVDVPVPPLNEQRRIVSKIESLESHREAAQEALEAVPPLLEKFRQSVLAAAFRGDLTREWRAQNPRVEPAGMLLEQIRAERKARFIEDVAETARAKAEAKAHDAGNPWGKADDADVVTKERRKAEKKYREPEPVDAEELPELPDGWCWARLEEVALIKGGLAKGKKRGAADQIRDVPYLRVANVQRGYLDLSEVKSIPATPEEIAQLALAQGDVLFNEGGDIDKLGRGWVWESALPLCIHQNHVFRARLVGKQVSPYFLSLYGNSHHARAYFLRSGKQTTNLASLNMTQLKSLPIPMAPAEEQISIVQSIDAQYEIAGLADSAFAGGRDRLTLLGQAILAKAFRGELVPQDPNDEPAGVLLERIRSVHENAKAETNADKMARLRPRKKAAPRTRGAAKDVADL